MPLNLHNTNGFKENKNAIVVLPGISIPISNNVVDYIENEIQRNKQTPHIRAVYRKTRVILYTPVHTHTRHAYEYKNYVNDNGVSKIAPSYRRIPRTAIKIIAYITLATNKLFSRESNLP